MEDYSIEDSPPRKRCTLSLRHRGATKKDKRAETVGLLFKPSDVNENGLATVNDVERIVEEYGMEDPDIILEIGSGLISAAASCFTLHKRLRFQCPNIYKSFMFFAQSKSNAFILQTRGPSPSHSPCPGIINARPFCLLPLFLPSFP